MNLILKLFEWFLFLDFFAIPILLKFFWVIYILPHPRLDCSSILLYTVLYMDCAALLPYWNWTLSYMHPIMSYNWILLKKHHWHTCKNFTCNMVVTRLLQPCINQVVATLWQPQTTLHYPWIWTCYQVITRLLQDYTSQPAHKLATM